MQLNFSPMDSMTGLYCEVDINATSIGFHTLKIEANNNRSCPESNYSNNSVSGTFYWDKDTVVGGTTDPYLHSIKCVDVPNYDKEYIPLPTDRNLTFEILIGNKGTSTVYNVPSTAKINLAATKQSGTIPLQTINTIPSGMVVGVRVTLAPVVYTTKIAVTGSVDPNREILDSDRSNNTYSMTFSARGDRAYSA